MGMAAMGAAMSDIARSVEERREKEIARWSPMVSNAYTELEKFGDKGRELALGAAHARLLEEGRTIQQSGGKLDSEQAAKRILDAMMSVFPLASDRLKFLREKSGFRNIPEEVREKLGLAKEEAELIAAAAQEDKDIVEGGAYFDEYVEVEGPPAPPEQFGLSQEFVQRYLQKHGMGDPRVAGMYYSLLQTYLPELLQQKTDYDFNAKVGEGYKMTARGINMFEQWDQSFTSGKALISTDAGPDADVGLTAAAKGARRTVLEAFSTSPVLIKTGALGSFAKEAGLSESWRSDAANAVRQGRSMTGPRTPEERKELGEDIAEEALSNILGSIKGLEGQREGLLEVALALMTESPEADKYLRTIDPNSMAQVAGMMDALPAVIESLRDEAGGMVTDDGDTVLATVSQLFKIGSSGWAREKMKYTHTHRLFGAMLDGVSRTEGQSRMQAVLELQKNLDHLKTMMPFLAGGWLPEMDPEIPYARSSYSEMFEKASVKAKGNPEEWDTALTEELENYRKRKRPWELDIAFPPATDVWKAEIDR
jgi:hypothetical protein